MMTEKEIEEMEDKIHAMSVTELKELFAKSTPIPININIDELPPAEPILEEDLILQSMSISELKALFDKSKPINLDEIEHESSPKKELKEKAAKTGLSKKVIKKIETNKHKATLEEIIAYCKGLKINFKDFLPELFGQSM